MATTTVTDWQARPAPSRRRAPSRIAVRTAAALTVVCALTHLYYVFLTRNLFGLWMLTLTVVCLFCARHAWRKPRSVVPRASMAALAGTMLALHFGAMHAGVMDHEATNGAAAASPAMMGHDMGHDMGDAHGAMPSGDRSPSELSMHVAVTVSAVQLALLASGALIDACTRRRSRR